MNNLYLYGVIEAREGAASAGTGVDGLSPVRTVVREGLGCVVSDYQGAELRALPKEELLRCLFAHQRVVERVMEHQDVLPVRFGTFLASPQEAQRLLSQGYGDFIDALASIRDRAEMEVAATWDTQRVLQEIGGEGEVVRAREALACRGQVTVADRVELGQIVKAHLDRRRGSYRERMLGALRPLAVAVAPNTLLSDEMVMNVAFLVDRARQHQFDEGVQRLDGLFQSEITFKLIGPLPPYSFATVVITRLATAEVQQARRTLHLSEEASEPAVRTAYRHLAAEAQGDQRPGDEPIERRLAQLRQASDLLVRYCRARGRAEAGAGGPGTARADGDGVFAIAIEGLRSADIAPARFGGVVTARQG